MFFPAIAEIRKAAGIDDDTVKEAALCALLSAIRRFGSRRGTPKHNNPEMARVVQVLGGWVPTCRMETQQLRRQFLQLYRPGNAPSSCMMDQLFHFGLPGTSCMCKQPPAAIGTEGTS
jgi:hypothetical protein